MGRIVDRVKGSREIAPADAGPSLDELFARAAELGRINVFQSERGTWSARIDLRTDRRGLTAEIHSGFGHATVHAAMTSLLHIAADGTYADLAPTPAAEGSRK